MDSPTSFTSVQSIHAKMYIASWQTGQVKDAFDQAHHQQDIAFLGYIKDEEVPLLMGSAYALTYISLFEGFGIPLLEAMNCNIPVITSNISSMPEVINNAGLTVIPTSIEDITSAMIKIYKNEDLRKSLSFNAQLQRQKFSWDLTSQRLEKSLNLLGL